MISVESLTKTFADAEAVAGITFNVEKGEILGLLGPNGAGKTTTMRMLTCFVTPTSGTARLAGYDIYDQSLEVRKNVGYLAENVPLYGELRVVEYLNFRARLKGVSRASVASRLDYVMDRCGLREVRSKVIDHLSKGYRQRVGLADALVHNPPILILDEPTVGLDPNQIRQVRELIRDLGREHTIILSSHILPEVEQVCGRIVIIHKGRIVAQDSTESLRQEIGGSSRLEVEIMGDRPSILEALGRLPGVLSVRETDGRGEAMPGDAAVAGVATLAAADSAPHRGSEQSAVQARLEDRSVQATVECAPEQDLREEVFRLAVDRGWVLLGLARRRLSLEDVFINLTTHDPVAEGEAGRAGPDTGPGDSSGEGAAGSPDSAPAAVSGSSGPEGREEDRGAAS